MENSEARRFRARYDYASKRRVWGIKAVVRKVFEEFDPEQLWKMGCPPDEYDFEIDEIGENIDRERGMMGNIKLDAIHLSRIFALVLHKAFGTWTEPVEVHERDLKMAERFLQLEAEAEQVHG